MADELQVGAEPAGNTEMAAQGTVAEDTDNPASTTALKAYITRCKKVRKDLSTDWETSKDYRRGKQFSTESDEDRISVNADWPLTKSKHASLFSQVPAITATTDMARYKPLAPVLAKAVNKRLGKSKVDVAMDEELPDVINMAGVAGCVIGYEARIVPKQVGTSIPQPQPEIPGQPPAPPPVAQPVDLSQLTPEEIQQAVAQGLLTVDVVDQVVDKRFYVTRISPTDLIWDVEFTGSDFDDSALVGQSGTKTWAEAKNCFRLKDEQRDQVVRGNTSTPTSDSRKNLPAEQDLKPDTVMYDELFYWSHKFNPDEKYFKKIMHVVFVAGLEEPVIHEPWQGQKFNEDGSYIGACHFPIQLFTLTYISDEAIPPSDSAIGRPQVDEQIRSRTQMVLQRDRSQPMRYYDVNRIDPAIQANIMRGTYQGMIPVNGDGSKALGEVSRAQYPSEDFTFDRIVKSDLQEQWQIGPNQSGTYASGDRSASESKIVESNFQTRTGQERGRVAKHFIRIAEVLFGLMALFDDFTELLDENDLAVIQQWDRKTEFVFTIRPDSTVLLDSEQRIQRLMRVLNLIGKAPGVNPKPLLEEIVVLSGLNPAEIVQDPQPAAPEPVNISVRSQEDLMNPLFLALLVKSQQAPSPQDLQAAIQMILAAHQGAVPLPPPEGDPTAGPQGIPSGPSDTQKADWQAQPRVTKRPEELGG